ncbi:MAG TPA: hypothetical protein DCE41_32635 [Cytophagales bacterium]|nr:hypothetical protein [Cytophagales bacterium]HAA22854.1 hypothetical protein [Cytophagales bacterium]HAP64428.1 hypothetical protein [Cytophagales bacterium]
MVAIVTLKVRLRKPMWLMRLFDVLSWALFFYLLVNLLGNLLAPTLTEALLFSPFSLLMAVLALRIAILRPGKRV